MLGVTLSAKKKSILDWSLAPPDSFLSLSYPPPTPHFSVPLLLHAAQTSWVRVFIHSPTPSNSAAVSGALGITPEKPSDISYLSQPAQVPHWAPTQPSPPMNGSGNSRCGSGSGRQGGKQPGPALRLGELQSTQSRLSAAQTP